MICQPSIQDSAGPIAPPWRARHEELSGTNLEERLAPYDNSWELGKTRRRTNAGNLAERTVEATGSRPKREPATRSPLIDVHAHYVTNSYIAAATEAGHRAPDGMHRDDVAVECENGSARWRCHRAPQRPVPFCLDPR